MRAAPFADPVIPDRLPDLGLPEFDPAWSRFVTVADRDGVRRRWHLLDTGRPEQPPVGTLLCVHGNPTWSYLWRRFLGAAPADWRVIAVDQLGMGWSERPAGSARAARPRDLDTRIADLGTLTDALDLTGPVVVAAHDWGGPVSLGWAVEHRDLVAGLVLTNTAVFQPLDLPFSRLIRLARSPALHEAVCVRTPIFVRAAAALSRPPLPAAVRAALALPYGDPAARRAIGAFVADVPLEADHPSRARLENVATGLASLADLPALILWGARDPVFTDVHLTDLVQRLPRADVHRFPRASHLVTEDAPETAAIAWSWITDTIQRRTPVAPRVPAVPGGPESLWAPLTARRDDLAPAVVECHGGTVSTTSFAELERRVADLALGLTSAGVDVGDRIALLVPPGVDLTAAVFACWRAGAVIVVADAGLGLRGMAHALRSARPDHVIGIAKALLALGVLRVPGRRIVADHLSGPLARMLGHPPTLLALTARGAALRRTGSMPVALSEADADAAVLFTSGATGPAKGVRYRRSQLRAQVDRLAELYQLTPDDPWVAAFAPFALYGPALGTGAAVPDMDVTAPRTLRATAMADAAAAVDARVVFASPAALRNVVDTAAALTAPQRDALARVRIVMSAGAPVPVGLLRQLQALVPNAALHTPYGMTEVLPVADISLPEIEAAGPGLGVCVGRLVPGVTVALSLLDSKGRATGSLTSEPGVTGEICVAAEHRKQAYDRLWATEQASSRDPGYHRTGDVGHLDDQARLWVEGRLVHVLTTAAGPLTPVAVEQRIESLPTVSAAAVVGVGPVGTQQVVAVVVSSAGAGWRRPLAEPDLATSVRAVGDADIAAVLTVPRLPTDIRHNSKIDRAAVAAWAGRVLSGRRAGRL